MLRTSPLTELDLLMGKFLGMMGFYLVLIASTLIYLAVLMVYGKPDLGQVLASYLGMVLMGCLFVSIGLFYSACTKEQIVKCPHAAGMITLGVTDHNFLLCSQRAARSFTGVHSYWACSRICSISCLWGNHIGDFAKGTVSLANVVYFLGFTGLFLFWTYLVLESRKWALQQPPFRNVLGFL